VTRETSLPTFNCSSVSYRIVLSDVCCTSYIEAIRSSSEMLLFQHCWKSIQNKRILSYVLSFCASRKNRHLGRTIVRSTV